MIRKGIFMFSPLVRLPLWRVAVVFPSLVDRRSRTFLLRLSSSAPAPPAMRENPEPKSFAHMLEEINAKQISDPDIIKIFLPDGTVKEGKKGLTTPMDFAKEIFKGSYKSLDVNAIVSQVNEVLWNMSRPLVEDCVLNLFTFETDEGRDTFWRSSAHILGESLTQLENVRNYDHRLLGLKQGLFFCHTPSLGYWVLLSRGLKVYNKLMKFIRTQHEERGYKEVETPNMCDLELCETSGHDGYYKENMLFEINKQGSGLKPMSCAWHCLMVHHGFCSYRDLPLRLADFGVDQNGLTWGRLLQQDHAHIFCSESQIKGEVKGVLEFTSYVYNIFGFTFELELSTRPEKYLGDIETWELAEKALSDALDEFGRPWQINERDGAFYGPKINISVFDSLKRKFQCATIQLDFELPAHFNLSLLAEDETKRERPVMIHRTILGSVERMFAILLEHYKGKWPFWLSPRQAIVCPVSQKSEPYALQVRDSIRRAGFDVVVDVDTTDRKINREEREALLAQYNYILVVGEEEANTEQISVRARDKQDFSVKSMEELLNHFKEEVAAFR